MSRKSEREKLTLYWGIFAYATHFLGFFELNSSVDEKIGTLFINSIIWIYSDGGTVPQSNIWGTLICL